MYRLMLKSITEIFDNTFALCSGIFAAILSYFLPTMNIVHVLIFFFLIDVLFGYWKSKKLYKMKFRTGIIWRTTIPRMLFSIILILCAFMWDETFNQELVKTYKVIGWFISGVLLYSIVANMYILTNWNVFNQLIEMIRNCVKGKTGLDINDK